MGVIRTVATALLVVLAGTGAALADWRVQRGLDVSSGGSSVLLIGEIDEQSTLYASCVAGNVALHIDVFDGKDHPLGTSGELELGVIKDGGPAWWTSGRQSRRPSWLRSAWSHRADIRRVLDDITTAKSTIGFIVMLVDLKTYTNFTISARGSTAAARQFEADCAVLAGGGDFRQLPTPSAPPASPPAPAAPPTPTILPALPSLPAAPTPSPEPASPSPPSTSPNRPNVTLATPPGGGAAPS